MKKKTLLCAFLIGILTLSIFFAGCKPKSGESSGNAVEYTEPYTPEFKTDYVRNPDCGFYQPISFSLKPEGISYSLKNYLKRNNLMHLRMNLAAFSAESIGTKALGDLGNLLGELRVNSVNAVIRFAYDGFNGYKDREPPMELLLRHVGQIGSVLKNYPDVLTAVEAGMIGPWGEMHSSAIAVKENFNSLLAAWIRVLDKRTPILARRPKMIADFAGIDVGKLDSHTSLPGTDEYRLGVFNDGYLGSSNDLGTYVNREKEVAWLSEQAAHTPFGGEVTIPGSKYNKIEYAAKEMFLTHTSYLNEQWNDQVVREWKETLYTAETGNDEAYFGKSAYAYIRDHLGYRFTVRDIVLPATAEDWVKIRFTVQNDGFGNLLKTKTCEVLLVKDGVSYVFPAELDPTAWLTGGSYAQTIELQTALDAGEYAVYLRLREPNSEAPVYAVSFANGVFEEALCANYLGKVTIG